MFDNEIMSPGKKLKKIRLFLKSTQEEVSDGICTKNRISQIEKHEKKINLKLAVGITGNLNRIAKLKKVDMVITVEELIMDEDNQSNNILTKNIINHLHEVETIDLFEKKLMEAEVIIEKYNITHDRKIQLYKLASNFYYEQNRYNTSDEMCNKGLRACLNSDNILEEAHFYVNKSRNSTAQNYNQQALDQLIYAEKINHKLCNVELSERIIFNRALTYTYMNKYDEALKCLYFLKDKFEIVNQAKLLSLNMICANCLNNLHEFEEAEIEYNKILHLAIKLGYKDVVAQAYRNLSELYFNKKDYTVAGMYIKKSLKNHPHNSVLNETLYFSAKVLKNLNEDVEIYLLRSLELCERGDIENIELVKDVIYDLILIYIEKEDEENLKLMLEKAEELDINCYLLYAELIKYYRFRDEEKSIYLNEKLICNLREN